MHIAKKERCDVAAVIRRASVAQEFAVSGPIILLLDDSGLHFFLLVVWALALFYSG